MNAVQQLNANHYHMYATSGGVGNKKFFPNGSQKMNVIQNSQALNGSPIPSAQMFLPATSQSTGQSIGMANMSIVSGSSFQKPPRKFVVPLATNKGNRPSGNNLDNIYSSQNDSNANDVSVNSIVTTAIGERGNIKIQNLVKNANSSQAQRIAGGKINLSYFHSLQ